MVYLRGIGGCEGSTAWLSVLIATDLKQLEQPERQPLFGGKQLILAVISPLPLGQIDESKRLD